MPEWEAKAVGWQSGPSQVCPCWHDDRNGRGPDVSPRGSHPGASAPAAGSTQPLLAPAGVRGSAVLSGLAALLLPETQSCPAPSRTGRASEWTQSRDQPLLPPENPEQDGSGRQPPSLDRGRRGGPERRRTGRVTQRIFGRVGASGGLSRLTAWVLLPVLHVTTQGPNDPTTPSSSL